MTELGSLHSGRGDSHSFFTISFLLAEDDYIVRRQIVDTFNQCTNNKNHSGSQHKKLHSSWDNTCVFFMFKGICRCGLEKVFEDFTVPT